MKTIGFIGGGRITRIFLQAFKNVDIIFDKVTVFDPNSEVLSNLQTKFPSIHVTTNDLAVVANNDYVILALHPPVLMETLAKIRDLIKKDAILVSLAPKLTISRMSEQLGGYANIARMNPSASTIINRGVNPICFSPEMSVENKTNLLKLLSPLGYTPEVKESKIEAYAVITAMGHTYFNFQIQKLTELALSFGLAEEEAQIAISEMLYTTSLTLYKSGLPYKEVADLVPVKPLAEVEETIKGYYDLYLNGIYNKIKPV
jgi:pyrroline-5-carboxylate reductase